MESIEKRPLMTQSARRFETDFQSSRISAIIFKPVSIALLDGNILDGLSADRV
jgi:hypothetical protein